MALPQDEMPVTSEAFAGKQKALRKSHTVNGPRTIRVNVPVTLCFYRADSITRLLMLI
jgi:hypothetical protein